MIDSPIIVLDPEKLEWKTTNLFGKIYRSVSPRNWKELMYAIDNDLLGQCKNTEVQVVDKSLSTYFDLL